MAIQKWVADDSSGLLSGGVNLGNLRAGFSLQHGLREKMKAAQVFMDSAKPT